MAKPKHSPCHIQLYQLGAVLNHALSELGAADWLIISFPCFLLAIWGVNPGSAQMTPVPIATTPMLGAAYCAQPTWEAGCFLLPKLISEDEEMLLKVKNLHLQQISQPQA